jgi:hypothetical protein
MAELHVPETRTPLEILVKEYLPQAAAQIENEVRKIEVLPVIKALRELATPVYGNDPNELIAFRFLYRAAVALLMGPTGIGKSSIVMQLAIHLAVGRALFGIEPGAYYRERGMRILLVQAENDEGDLAEMRDGVLKGCEDLSADEKRLAQERIQIVTVCDRSAERFTQMLDVLLEKEGPFDLVIVDPAFAYLGGDSNSQADVSHFMRELLNPLLHKHNVGMILCHHTNKPLRGKEKDGWAAGDFAYLGAGSAEWINPARAALAIRSIGSDRVFELRAAKRGRRLGWKDADGVPTNVRFIAHHDEPGVICWREATAEEVEEVFAQASGGGTGTVGRPRKCGTPEVLHCIRAMPGENQAFYKTKVAVALGCSGNAVQNTLLECLARNLVEASQKGLQKLYSLTPKGQDEARHQPSAIDWNKQ